MFYLCVPWECLSSSEGLGTLIIILFSVAVGSLFLWFCVWVSLGFCVWYWGLDRSRRVWVFPGIMLCVVLVFPSGVSPEEATASGEPPVEEESTQAISQPSVKGEESPPSSKCDIVVVSSSGEEGGSPESVSVECCSSPEETPMIEPSPSSPSYANFDPQGRKVITRDEFRKSLFEEEGVGAKDSVGGASASGVGSGGEKSVSSSH